MSATSLETRVAALETEVARLKHEQAVILGARRPWWEEIRGTFKNDTVTMRRCGWGGNGATLLTSNLSDFRNVPGLRVDDWSV